MVNNESYCVYKHTCPNGKVYVGITSQNPLNRWGKNGIGYVHNQHFYNAILKYGWDNIKHEILYSDLSKEEACEKEIELIAEYKSNNPDYGYNHTIGGFLAGKHSEETKRKIAIKTSEAQKGKRTGENNGFYGKRHDFDFCLKISNRMKGENNPRCKSVICMETGEIFPYIKRAAEIYKLSPNSIIKCCKNQDTSVKGYHWRYADE